MMRVVFLLFAEERSLLPQGVLFAQGYGISGELDRLDRRVLADSEESLDSTYLTWHRLLATSQALYAGASFENMRMPAYGGSLFDPARFTFLSEVSDHGSLRVTVSDRAMLHVLRSVQTAVVKGEARRISFRDIDVEQIGYVYEGLLGYTCFRVTEPTLGLLGKSGEEPEFPLAALESLGEQHDSQASLASAVLARLKASQPSSAHTTAGALVKNLAKVVPSQRISALSQVAAGMWSFRSA